ncbi:MAG: hypothetical protein RL490_2028 [Pseudomonadota bacterium]
MPVAGLGSVTTRLVALVFGLQILITAIVLTYVYAATEREVARQERAVVAELRDDLVASYRSGGEIALTRLIRARLAAAHGDLVLALAGSDGRIIAGNLAEWPQGMAPGSSWRVLTLARTGVATPERMGVVTLALGQGRQLLAGRVVESNLRLARINTEAILAALLVAVPLALLLALLLGRILTDRLSAISGTAAAVTGGDLSQRVPRDGSGDAFDTLAGAVNTMLDRVDGLIGELRIVTDGLAHDLRSPLTRLKSTLERARGDTDDATALAALDNVAGEADQVLAMLAMALQISRAEAGIGRDRFVTTDVDALIADIVEVFGPSAEDQGLALTVAGTSVGSARLHRDLVQQALSNLVENALHYADGATAITVGAHIAVDQLILTVADDGIGIPADRRDDARRRFVRLDPARHASGAGLGLALVEAVVRLHDGELRLADNAPGLRVEMLLPLG